MKKLISTIALFLTLTVGNAHELTRSDRSDINEILDSYSERTGVKFRKHFAIKARVTMIGLEIDELTQTNLMDILFMHAFTAYENNEGEVYVLPTILADTDGAEFGEIWGSQ